MSLPLSFLVFGFLCHSVSGTSTYNVVENQTATLACPHADGHEVRWARYINGQKTVLVASKDGQESRSDKRFGTLADMSLTITRVKESDSSMYLCNDKPTAYMRVIKDPGVVARGHPEDPDTDSLDTPKREQPTSGREPSRGGTDEAEDGQESKGPTHGNSWKVVITLVIGGATVGLLSAILIRRYRSKRREAVRTGSDQTKTEVIYEEIGDSLIQPREESDIERPYDLVRDPQSHPKDPLTSAPDPLYATVSKPNRTGVSHEACVYYLAQSP